MSLRVNRTATYTIELDEETAGKLMRSLGRVMNVLGNLDQQEERYQWLVNTHTVDDLLALKTALYMALPEDALEETGDNV